MMIKKFRMCLMMGVVLLGLTACGFQLRNHNELAQPLHTVYLQTDNPYGSLESSLRQTLRSSGVKLADTANAAPVTLQLSKPAAINSTSTMGPSSQSRAYTLAYAVTFALVNTQGKILVGPETLQASRSLILSANQLPQSNNQTDILNHEMERDIINQLYNRLRSKQVAEALSLKPGK